MVLQKTKNTQWHRLTDILLFQKGTAECQVESFLRGVSNAVKNCICVQEILIRRVPAPHNTNLLNFAFSSQFLNNEHNAATYPLFVTMHFIPAAFAAARPMALSSTTTHLHCTTMQTLFRQSFLRWSNYYEPTTEIMNQIKRCMSSIFYTLKDQHPMCQLLADRWPARNK